ncbi:glycosyltransferase family 2 protein [Winogradskyella marincola]|uniref:Glycosyltransferase family 2 protein n=1 Tax=Winogradskyella marincola TaxID=3037795 RepID=A0ABT6FX87_9FLAO|nr:glycosyltransferase family 2 protein [Winogradskyella sp. YYF002]MDG4714395.1 glycosyltransferase family 2 protein [Winogradskyella sp. YYF002]
MKLSVVILNYNVRYFLELCLRSVEAATKDIDSEIIVVDNKSPDDSCAMVKELFPNVKLIENKENYGFSKGNNIGVASAKGEYLCILNPDTVVAEDTFIKIIAFADQQTNLGIVGCQLIDGRGKFLPESKRHIPTPKVALQKLIGNSKKYYDNNLAPNDIGKTEILVGAFMLLKQDVYKEVKGLDEDYFMYGEDVDLSYKVLKAGYDNYYYGKTSVIHYKGESTLKDKVYAKRFYGAMGIFYKKHYKKNILILAMVKIVLSIASKRKSLAKLEAPTVKETIVISETKEERLINKIQNSVSFQTHLDTISDGAQFILDVESFGYKAAIDFIKTYNTTKQNTYRIWVKSSNFILGSDSSVGRGEVVSF